MKKISELWEIYKNSKKVTTGLIITLFLLINWIGYGFYARIDLSDEGTLRLTGATKKILKELPEKVIIEAFFSSDIPDAQLVDVKQARDFLQEYASAGRGKVKLVFLDPDSDKDAKDRAQQLGIQPAPMGSIDTKKQEVRNVYFSVAMTYGTKVETLPNILNSRVLEYEMTVRIFRMVNPGERRIGLLSNGPFKTDNQQDPLHSLHSFDEGLKTFYGSVREVNAKTSDISGDIGVLLVLNPENLDDMEKFRIDQYLLRGGNVILALSGMKPDFQQWMAFQANPAAIDFFKSYGIIVGTDMIHEPKVHIPFLQRVNPFEAMEFPYPPWVISPKELISQDNIISKGVNGLFFPYPSSLKTDATILPTGEGEDKFKTLIIAKTTGNAWAQQNVAMIHPLKMKDSIEGEKQNVGTYNLAILIEGKFKSAFTGKPIPKDAPKDALQKAVKPGKILALSSPYVLSDLPMMVDRIYSGNLRVRETNLKFLLSAVDVMSGLEELVALRKKQTSAARYKNIGPGEKQIWTLLNFILPLAVIAGFGIFRALRRKKLSLSTFNPSSEAV